MTTLVDIGASSISARGLQRSEHRLLLVAGDVTAACAAVVVALWAWSLTTGFAFGTAFLWQWRFLWVTVPIWVGLLSSARRIPLAYSLDSTVRRVLTAALTLLALYGVTYFYAPPETLPRLPAAYFLWEASLLTLGWRLLYLFVFTKEGFRRRVAVIGAGTGGRRIATLLRTLSRDVQVVAVVDDEPWAGPDPLPVWPLSALDRFVQESGVTEIVIARPNLPPEIVHDLVRWQEQGVTVVPMAAEYEHLLMRVPVEQLDAQWMFTSLSEWTRARDASSSLKRALDVTGALVGLVVLAVATPLVALVVLLESGMPVFYRQVRLGAHGRPFTLVKFRTMVRNAEEDGPRWAARSDPRVTAVGRWLRRSRLDELPQMIAVLRGDMSLVGPRPERPEFVEQLERAVPFYRARLMVPPGLTGWAQVCSAYGASAEDAVLKLEYDLYYIKHRSLLFDLWILVRTAATMFRLGGR